MFSRFLFFFLKIGLSETPYSAFPGSNAINSYVYLVELFSESRYSCEPKYRKFMIPKFLKQRFMILTCFVTMIHYS